MLNSTPSGSGDVLMDEVSEVCERDKSSCKQVLEVVLDNIKQHL